MAVASNGNSRVGADLCHRSSRSVFAQGLVADLSNHLIAITTDFTGQELLLFGTIQDPETQNVVVVVTGPQQTVTVRQKKGNTRALDQSPIDDLRASADVLPASL